MKTIKGSDQNYIELAVEIKAASAKAFLLHDGSVEAWVPKSQIEDITMGEGSNALVILPEWLAKDKGFI